LKAKFDKARALLSAANGIDMSYVEQVDKYNLLLNEYKLKVDLLDQYKRLADFQLDTKLIDGSVDESHANGGDYDMSFEANRNAVNNTLPSTYDMKPEPKDDITDVYNESFDLNFD
jgi:hypothetical protein